MHSKPRLMRARDDAARMFATLVVG